MIRLAIAIAICSCGCVSYASIAVAPNGVVWIARNVQGSGGAVAHDVLACAQTSGELRCSKVPVRVSGE